MQEFVLSFDRRGPLVSFLVLAAPAVVLLGVLMATAHREKMGPWQLSRRFRIPASLVVASLYFGTLYGFIYWRTFYELTLFPGEDRLELTLLMPERILTLALDDVAGFHRGPGPRPYKHRLLIETSEGRVYRSPSRITREIATMEEALRERLHDLDEMEEGG